MKRWKRETEHADGRGHAREENGSMLKTGSWGRRNGWQGTGTNKAQWMPMDHCR